MWIKILLILIIPLIAGCNKKTAPAFIWEIYDKDKFIGCLVGSAHWLFLDAHESLEFKNCKSKTQSLGVEININNIHKNVYEYYPKSGKFSFSNLNHEVISGFEECVVNANISDDYRQYLQNAHPVFMYRYILDFSNTFQLEKPLKTGLDLLEIKKAAIDGKPIFEVEGVVEFSKNDMKMPLELIQKNIISLCKILKNEKAISNLKNKTHQYLLDIENVKNVNEAYELTKNLYENVYMFNANMINYNVTNRNNYMALKIIKYSTIEMPMLTIVGMAHLGGELGIVNILKSKNYNLIKML